MVVLFGHLQGTHLSERAVVESTLDTDAFPALKESLAEHDTERRESRSGQTVVDVFMLRGVLGDG